MFDLFFSLALGLVSISLGIGCLIVTREAVFKRFDERAARLRPRYHRLKARFPEFVRMNNLINRWILRVVGSMALLFGTLILAANLSTLI